MLMGRSYEYAYLEDYRRRPGSQLVVFYGQKFLGKTTFLLDFCKERPFSYCLVKSGCEERLLQDLYEAMQKLSEITASEKKILIVDEFQNLSRAEAFMPACLDFMEKENVFIVLVSSAANWVESSMVKCFGRNAARINGFYKCGALSFTDICQLYPSYAKTDLFILYSIFGGVLGLWNFLDPAKSVEDNIRDVILSKKSYLRHTGYRYCLEGLRETGVYDTILSSMAGENTKLNDLYKATGYSRAKISVYLKNLMEQEQIKKVYSIDCPGMENSKKGIYEISSHFTNFWFTFIYPHERELSLLSETEFYHRYIKDRLAAYCNRYIRKIVREYFANEGIYTRESKASPDRFLGKRGEIDLVWKCGDGYRVVWCRQLKAMVTYEDFVMLEQAAEEAGMKVIDYYLVSYKAFDEKLTLEARVKQNIHLLTLAKVMNE